MQLFGISIPVIQLAGGIMICKMGWDSLSDNQDQSSTETPATDQSINISNNLFYPLTFPVTTGAGTISVLFTLSAHSANADWGSYLVNTLAILTAIVVMCLLVFIFYGNTKRLMHRLDGNGRKVLNRISAFLIFCVGLQVAVSGIKGLL